MLNPERVDLVGKGINRTIEIEFTTEKADPALMVVIDARDGEQLLHMLQSAVEEYNKDYGEPATIKDLEVLDELIKEKGRYI